MHDTNTTSRRNPITHHNKCNSILKQLESFIFCFLQPIISASFALQPVLLCAFTVQSSPKHFATACSHLQTRKRRPWQCVPSSFFQIAEPCYVFVQKHLACLPCWVIVVILAICPHHEKYWAKYFSLPCRILCFDLQFRSNLEHLAMCDSVLS